MPARCACKRVMPLNSQALVAQFRAVMLSARYHSGLQVAHFLEADLQPWAAALAGTLFGTSDPTGTLAAAPDEQPQASAVGVCATDTISTLASASTKPPQPSTVDGNAQVPPWDCAAPEGGCAARQGDSAATVLDAAWRHLDSLSPLGDASSVVLRAWRLPLLQQLAVTPAEWQPAVIGSHTAAGALTLDGTTAAACGDSMRRVHDVHSLTFELPLRAASMDSKVADGHALAAIEQIIRVSDACNAVCALPALRRLRVRGGEGRRLEPPHAAGVPRLLRLRLPHGH